MQNVPSYGMILKKLISIIYVDIMRLKLKLEKLFKNLWNELNPFLYI